MAIIKKEYALRCADYVLCGDYEYSNMVQRASDLFITGMNRYEVRKSLKDSYYYAASCLIHGKREASKSITEIMREVRP